jgi:hypothetical protein
MSLIPLELIENGSPKVIPYFGASAQVLTNGAVVLQIVFADTPAEGVAVAQGKASPRTIQLGVMPEQLDQLIELLTNQRLALQEMQAKLGRPN